MYVEATISPKVQPPKRKNAITSWNIGLLRKRESTEIAAGGFGMLPMKPEYMSSNIKQEKRNPHASKTHPKEPEKKVYRTLIYFIPQLHTILIPTSSYLGIHHGA